MPHKPLRFCSHPNCNELTTERYCPQHKAEHEAKYQESKTAYDKTRLSSSERGYDEQWRKTRKAYLHQHPLCEMCEAKGLTTPAVLVHHIKPLSEGGARLQYSNLQALCNDCHEGVHGKDRWKRKDR